MTDAMWKAVQALQGRDDIKLGVDLRDIVRAVLTAVRTPDAAMLKAALADADKQGWLARREYYSNMEVGLSWQSMIDAILAEEPAQ